MKLLNVISSVDPKGGGPIEGVRQLQSQMTKAGVTVHVVCCDAPDSPWIANTGLAKVFALGPARFGYNYCPNLLPWLRANASRYDAVIVNGLWQYHGFAVWRALAGSKTPYFVFTHGMLDPWFKHSYPLKHLKKWLYWPWGEYRVLRDARRVIFTCEDEKLLARESFWLYKANEAVTSYGTSSPPVEAEVLKEVFLSACPALRGKRLALFLSRIQAKKGCDLLVEAFAKAASKDASLHLVMAGPDQEGWVTALQAQALRLGIADRITWPGMLQGDLKWGAYYAAEVFCLPSHQENFGIVVAEALACGKPVLISNKVNIWREIEADRAGFVADDTLDGTVLNFERWQALADDEYMAISTRAISTFNKRFHIERAAEKLLSIIGENTN
jgi:glycosyltransferase involved in cell wall biosynthesis